MKKKILAILLGMTMLIGVLAGCSGNSQDSAAEEAPPADGETQVQTEDETQSADASDGELDTLDIFINFSWFPVDKFEGIIPDYVKEKTGVDLNVTIATDANQLGVMIGSGELPDLVYTDVELDRLSNPNLCYSFTELEENFGASFDNAREEAVSIARSLSSDGEYYTLLNNYNTNEEWENLKLGAPGQAAIYYRKDLLEQLGNPEINTVDDFMAVLEQCKTQFPDMTPFGLGGYWKFQALSNFMGVLSSQYNPETGDYYYEASAPAYKDFLKAANYMARNGYVTPESYANENEGDGHQAAYNNGCVFYPWHLSYANFTQLQSETQKIHPEAEWVVLPKFGEGASVGTSRGWSGCFVSKNCSNPEAAARLLTFLHSPEGQNASMWGREGIDYTLDADGVPTFSDEFMTSLSDGSFTEKYNQMFYFGATAIHELYMNYSGLDDEILAPFTSYGEGYKNYPELGVAEPLSSSDEGVIKAKMEELKKSYEARVIFTTSDEEFEAVYEEYMDALEQTGLSEYNQYMKTSIQEAKALLGIR